MQQEILTEVHDHVLVITINRPSAKNAINDVVAEGLVVVQFVP
jgi:enoyl-CoA hydratase/carnithine racemase